LETSRTNSAEAIVAVVFAPRIGADFRTVLEKAVPGAYEQAVEDANAALLLDLPAVVGFRFSSDDARLIDQPTLCVIGEKSENLWDRFGEVQRALLAWLPNAEGFVLPGASHALQMQNPVDLTGRLAQFLESHRIES
jgi:pimeloyl-ACP methyl ester carboxylesterase